MTPTQDAPAMPQDTSASDPGAPKACPSPTPRPHLPLWRWLLRAVVVLALFVAFDVGACFVFETYGGFAESVWYQYRMAADEPIDTLVIGSSVAEYAFQPQPLADELGASSVCLSTPAQSLRCTLMGVRRAVADHDIRRVIVGTSYNTLIEETSANSDSVFVQNALIGQPLAEQVATYADLILNGGYVGGIESLGFLFPWSMSHVQYNPQAVMTNIRNRLECPTPMEAQARVEPRYRPLGHGFANYVDDLNTTTFLHGSIAANNHYNIALNPVQVRYLRELCELCQSQGIELVMVITPRPTFATIAYPEDTYASDMATIQQLVESYGGIFMDYSIAKADFYDQPEKDFIDDVHLNQQGAMHFSNSFAATLAEVERGVDVSDRFWHYDEWDKYLASLGRVEYVWFDSQVVGSKLNLTADTYAAPGLNLEFEFAVKPTNDQEAEWTVVRDYDADPTCTVDYEDWNIAHFDALDIRVRVRQVGATQPDTWHTETVGYRD